jgi:short-subunit dehydrogenase
MLTITYIIIFIDALRREVDHFGISVSLIEPAYVKTSIFESTATSYKPSLTADMQSIYHPFFSGKYTYNHSYI